MIFLIFLKILFIQAYDEDYIQYLSEKFRYPDGESRDLSLTVTPFDRFLQKRITNFENNLKNNFEYFRKTSLLVEVENMSSIQSSKKQ